jgi:hypothetical protein
MPQRASRGKQTIGMAEEKHQGIFDIPLCCGVKGTKEKVFSY